MYVLSVLFYLSKFDNVLIRILLISRYTLKREETCNNKKRERESRIKNQNSQDYLSLVYFHNVIRVFFNQIVIKRLKRIQIHQIKISIDCLERVSSFQNTHIHTTILILIPFLERERICKILN